MKNKILYVIITILLMIISSGATYIVMQNLNSNNEITKDNENKANKDNQTEDKETNVKKDGVKLVATKNSNGNITESFEVTLNGQKHTFNIEFIYEADTTYETPGHILKGIYNDKELYYSSINKDSTKSEYFNITKIREHFNENNFIILKGEDNKNYLALVVNKYPDTLMYLFDENLEQITDVSLNKKEYNTFIITEFYNSVISVENEQDIWYPNNYNLQYNEDKAKSNVKIDNNAIYYLVTNSNNEVEERIYTINNNKLEYKLNNKYKIKELGNVTT